MTKKKDPQPLSVVVLDPVPALVEPPANEHPPAAPPPEHAQQAVDLPLDRIRPPMLQRELGDLVELSGSIKLRGVIQAIVVRPRPDPDGSEAWETVAGWRRVNASKLAGKRTIPGVVRELSDGEALELLVDENLQRKDFGPLEEAEAFAKFLQLPGYTIPRIAERFAKSAPHVAQRIQLLKLSDASKKALATDAITLQVALLIARLPNHSEQDEILDRVKGRDGMAPEPVDFVRETIEQQFLLRLDRAPWKLDDGELVPEAGPCSICPKQTGAQGHLFPDTKKSLCIDRTCWRSKLDAAWKRREKRAKESGETLLSGKKAEKALALGGSELTRLEGEFWSPKLGEMVKVKKLLGKDLPPLTIAQHPETREHVTLVPTADVERAIAAQVAAGGGPPDDDGEAEQTHPATDESHAEALADAAAADRRARVTEQAIRLAVIRSEGVAPSLVGSILARWLMLAAHVAALKGLAENRQVPGKGIELDHNLDKWIDEMPYAQRVGVAVELALRLSLDKLPGLKFREWVFEVLEIDLAEVEKSIERQDEAARREAEHPGAKAPKGKKGKGSKSGAVTP